jgi:hypothetical protein
VKILDDPIDQPVRDWNDSDVRIDGGVYFSAVTNRTCTNDKRTAANTFNIVDRGMNQVSLPASFQPGDILDIEIL